MQDLRQLKDYPLKLDYSDDESVETDNADNPHVYDSMWEYVMSAVGVCVGFGSFWRFPSLVFKNGGGVFLIPYLIAMVLMGMPLLYLETSIGQMHRMSIPFAFKKIHPSLKIVGLGIMASCFMFSSVYNVILTYCYRFLFVSFQSPLPFADEDITDNKFFHEQILHQSSGIDQFGGINPFLFFIYIGSLIICHMVIKQGAKTSGKIIMVTASAPFFMFIILVIRGLFLSGAWEGIVFLFKPNWDLLWTPGIWIDATTQVFYQLTIGVGTMVNLSTQKARRQDVFKSVLIVPLGLILCGLLSALTIFIYLSHFCLLTGRRIGDPNLAISGFQLSFNVLPKALLLLPLPNLWILLFFFAMVLLGIDSQFGVIQSMYIVLRDEFKNGPKSIYGFYVDEKRAQWLTIAAICIAGAPTLTSHAGIYYLSFYDYFMSNIPYTLWVTLELYFFVHVFKFQQIMAAVKRYTKNQTPWIIKKCLQSYWLPGLLVANIFFASVQQLLNQKGYSIGFYLFGWLVTLYPLIMIYVSLRKEWRGWEELKLTFKELQNRKSQF